MQLYRQKAQRATLSRGTLNSLSLIIEKAENAWLIHYYCDGIQEAATIDGNTTSAVAGMDFSLPIANPAVKKHVTT
jgi:ABC-type maltose transport system permease subunit